MSTVKNRMISFTLVVVLLISLSVGILAQAASPVVSEEKLLEAADPVLTAYEEHYVVQNVRITSPSEVFEEDGAQYITFFLTFDAALKYDSAVDLPRVQGIAQALNLGGNLQSVQEFSTKLHASDAIDTLQGDVQTELQTSIQASRAMEAVAAAATEAKNTAESEPALTSAQKVDLISNYVLDKMDTYVADLQAEYIGTSSEFNVDLRAMVDGQGNVLKLQYGVFDEYSDDISTVIPASNERMVQEGKQQVAETIDMALEKVEQHASFSAITPASNTSFIYYRTKARDYANKYTVNAGERYCSTHKQNIRQSAQYYNPAYFYFCCNDCANYVSQAMYAGGVPKDNIWIPNKQCAAWNSCSKLLYHFTTKTNYWTKTTYRNCNAGGVIVLFKDNKPYHVMMNVLNDSVTTKYSAHTNDRNQLTYTHAGLLSSSSTDSIQYYVFDRVSPAH